MSDSDRMPEKVMNALTCKHSTTLMPDLVQNDVVIQFFLIFDVAGIVFHLMKILFNSVKYSKYKETSIDATERLF